MHPIIQILAVIAVVGIVLMIVLVALIWFAEKDQRRNARERTGKEDE